MALTRERLENPPVATTKVSVPEFGDDEHAYLRKLSLKGREDWECWSQGAQGVEGEGLNLAKVIADFGGWRGYLLARTLCDEQGVLLFDDPAEAVEVLGGCPASVMDRLYDEAVAFNALGPDDLEELEGNSEVAPSEDSP